MSCMKYILNSINNEERKVALLRKVKRTEKLFQPYEQHCDG